jgi:periplasmic divalent cation tolerance protein
MPACPHSRQWPYVVLTALPARRFIEVDLGTRDWHYGLIENEERLVIAITTAPSANVAEDLAQKLVIGGLAACVQYLPINSCFQWEGKVSTEPEILLLIKTRSSKINHIEDFISSNHPYEVPELVFVEAEKTSSSYWK